ncbi:hypothetical protein BGX29_001766 [Mortierella sp. GBA35]|nr:hypothetical protein BGX29_001766 [Mortierella sp. GBA35]
MAALYVVVQYLQLIEMYRDPNEEFYDEDQALAPYRSRVGRPFPLDHSFDVRAFSTEYCREHYMFTCTQLQEILDFLGLRGNIVTKQRDNIDSLTAFCMVIYRITYPARLNRMEETFRRSAAAISRIINHFIAVVVYGTVQKIPAPTIGQQAMYNGHKHMHAIKYQAGRCST